MVSAREINFHSYETSQYRASASGATNSINWLTINKTSDSLRYDTGPHVIEKSRSKSTDGLKRQIN